MAAPISPYGSIPHDGYYLFIWLVNQIRIFLALVRTLCAGANIRL